LIYEQLLLSYISEQLAKYIALATVIIVVEVSRAMVSYDLQPPFEILPLLLSHHLPRPIAQPATSVLTSIISTPLCASPSLLVFLFSWFN
jgi:hypothetical protein